MPRLPTTVLRQCQTDPGTKLFLLLVYCKFELNPLRSYSLPRPMLHEQHVEMWINWLRNLVNDEGNEINLATDEQ